MQLQQNYILMIHLLLKYNAKEDQGGFCIANNIHILPSKKPPRESLIEVFLVKMKLIGPFLITFSLATS